MRFWLSCSLLTTLAVSATYAACPSEMFGWTMLEFMYPSAEEREAAINNKSFIPGNAIPLDMDGMDGRMFITSPRINRGTPASLSSLLLDNTSSPSLQPYPNWQWHRQGNCDGLTSVWRMEIDECGRLWALDSGIVDWASSDTQLCPPKLVVFNLATDEMILEHRFPDSFLKEDSNLITVVVDVQPGKCDESFAYVADVGGYGLLVFDLQTRSSWRVESNFFYPDPRWGHFNVAGGEFDLMDGILGMALSPRLTNGDRRLYWHSLASDSEGYVLASVLQDRNAFQDGFNSRAGEFFLFDGRRSSQAAAEAMSSDAIMFFSQLSNNSLNCWNAWHTYGPPNTAQLCVDDERLQFVTGVKVILNPFGGEDVWMVSNRFQLAATGSLNESDINFRLMVGATKSLVAGSVCEKTGR